MPSDSISHHSSKCFRKMSDKDINSIATTSRERIEHALKNLALGEQIFIDTEGGIHESKGPFLRSERAPLVSFTATSNGFVVNSGVPPRHKTYVGREEDIAQETRPLKYSVVVSSGSYIGLTELCLFEVPSSKEGLPDPGKEALEGIEGLQAALAYAEEGDVVVLGRSAVKSGTLHGAVSRQHVTAFVEEKKDNGDGTFVLRLLLKLGIPSEAIVEIDQGSGYGPVRGERLVNGGRLKAEAVGEIRIPHPLGSIEEHSFDTMRSFVEFGTLLNEFQVDERSRLKRLVVASYLAHGLELVRNGSYAEAYQLFLDGAGVLENAGYRLRIASIHQATSLSENSAATTIEEMAQHSRCNNEKKQLELVTALPPSLEEENTEQRGDLKLYYKEASLIYARVYGCLLQAISEKPISKSAVLIEGLSSEADIAAYFYEQGVLFSDLYAERYPDLTKAIQILVGYQTDDEQIAFKTILNTSQFGELITIGANLFSDEIVIEERREALSNLQERAGEIRRNPDGTYTLFSSDRDEESAICVADKQGFYRKLQRAEVVDLEPGGTIYLGEGFRLELP